MKKKLLILLVTLSVLSLLTYVFTNTNILKGTFKILGDGDIPSQTSTSTGTVAVSDFFDTSIITVEKAGNGASEIDWSSSTEYTLGEWTVTTDETLTIDLLYSYIGDPEKLSTDLNNYTQAYFENTTLTVTASNGNFDTASVSFPDTDFAYPLAKDTYTFTLKGTPIATQEDNFNANGFNGNEIAFSIYKVTTDDGTSYQQGSGDGSDYFTYDETVDANTGFSYGGYTLTSKGYSAEPDAEDEEVTDEEVADEEVADEDVTDIAGEIIELSLIEKYSGVNLMSEIDAADLTVYNSANTETPVSASIDEKIITDSSSVSLFPIFSVEVPEGEYYITVSHAGFVQNTFGPYSTAVDGYNAVTNEGELEYSYYVNVQDESSSAITNATVTADSGYLDCSYLYEGLYACPVASEQASLTYTVTAEGYDDYNGEFSTLISATLDSSETADVTLVATGTDTATDTSDSCPTDDYGCIEDETAPADTTTDTATDTDTTTDTSSTDTDSDGLSDAEEEAYGSDADSFDTDGDGLSDGDEVNLYGTNPLSADTDYDGYNDYTELSTGNDPLIYNSSTATSPSSSSSTSTSSTTSTNDTSAVTPVASGQRAEILSSNAYRCSDSFTDTNGHWAEDTICRLYKASIVNGKDNNTFAPDDYITRAEFLKVALLNAGYTSDDANGLSEDYTAVNASDWFYPYVKIAEAAGVLRNQGGAFHPNDKIKRADAIVLSVRIARQTLYGYVQSDIPFSDVRTSDYFAYAVIIGSNTQVETPEEEIKSVIGGYADGTFRPNNYISRAEVAAMTIRAFLAWYN